MRARRRTVAAGITSTVLMVTAVLVGVNRSAVSAVELGPDPTVASITAPRGPFATATSPVTAGNGFGGGTIYYPTDPGTYGAIVTLPGFINPGSVMAPYGQRLASHGFVVLVANTNTVLDFPAQRATEGLAALDWLTQRSPVASKTDPSRQAMMGYSMGGGGTLAATQRRPSLKAAVPMAPWNLGTSYTGDRVPTMVVTCVGDPVAPPASMGRPWYNQLSGPKAYFQMSAGSHGCPLTAAQAIGNRVVVWMKRYLDDDARYQQFLCPQPIAASGSTGWLSANVC